MDVPEKIDYVMIIQWMKGIMTPRGERVWLCRENLQNKHQRGCGGLTELNQVNGDRTENSNITLEQPSHAYVISLNFFPLWKRESEYKYPDDFILFYKYEKSSFNLNLPYFNLVFLCELMRFFLSRNSDINTEFWGKNSWKEGHTSVLKILWWFS
jgi:hypothetical protein